MGSVISIWALHLEVILARCKAAANERVIGSGVCLLVEKLIGVRAALLFLLVLPCHQWSSLVMLAGQNTVRIEVFCLSLDG